jgi:hypothetical protein
VHPDEYRKKTTSIYPKIYARFLIPILTKKAELATNIIDALAEILNSKAKNKPSLQRFSPLLGIRKNV